MRDLMDILAVCFLMLILGGALYAIIMLMFNGLLSTLKFRIKLPVQKRFVGKMTPIYKLSSWADNDVKRMYFLQKWELQYTDIEMGSCKQFGYHLLHYFKDYNMLKESNLT